MDFMASEISRLAPAAQIVPGIEGTSRWAAKKHAYLLGLHSGGFHFDSLLVWSEELSTFGNIFPNLIGSFHTVLFCNLVFDAITEIYLQNNFLLCSVANSSQSCQAKSLEALIQSNP